MNLLFLTLVQFESIKEHGIYTDLLREFGKNGHNVYAISPIEKREDKKTHINKEDNAIVLRLQIGNTQKTSIIEKGISTILIEPKFKSAIRKYFFDVKFDLILYSTPPITLVGAIEYVKKRDNARTYLLLKDIFPQNAVDIGLMKKKGVHGVIYKYFRKQERRLYKISDRIGCMSPANVQYIIRHNHEINPGHVEVCPNSVEVVDKSIDDEARTALRAKYKIPLNKTVFVYGGNLGKPQDIPFIIDCIRTCQDIKEAFFLIVGDGTEYHIIRDFIKQERPQNIRLLKRLPKEDYDKVVASCDVGLIFLDHRFTIPNFPSRLLSYMQAKLPVLACTDLNTDVGKVIVDGGFGLWCESKDIERFSYLIDELTDFKKCKVMGDNSYKYLLDHYDVSISYGIIMNLFSEKRDL